MLLYANTSVFMWKSIVFWFCTVWCLHARCEMRYFYTLRCPAPFWLIQCKPYRNRLIIAKVIDKSLGTRFLWPTVYNGRQGKITATYYLQPTYYSNEITGLAQYEPIISIHCIVFLHHEWFITGCNSKLSNTVNSTSQRWNNENHTNFCFFKW